jgi:Domain of unknown function (DUF6438)
MSRALVLVIVAACDAGAKPAPPPPAPTPAPPHHKGEHLLLASIDRGGCYGTCPIYTFTVYRDGAFEYFGKDFVVKKDNVSGTLTDQQLDALDKLFTDNQYLSLADSYEHYDVTDASSVTTSYRPPGATKTKTIAHYHGDLHAPAALDTVEQKFDENVQISRWIGTPAEREKIERR